MKEDIDLARLKQKELDFYNYCISNPGVIDLDIKELAKIYGIGISFIYSMLEKLNIKHYREFIYHIGYVSGIKKQISGFTTDENDSIINEINNVTLISNIRNIHLFSEQKNLILELIKKIQLKNKIFCIGFGYSKLAIEDLFGFFNKWEKKFSIINDENDYDTLNLNLIKKDDLIIIFSMRATNNKIVSWVKKISLIVPIDNFFLITANPKTKLKKNINNTILVDNIMKRINEINNTILVSPLSSFLQFNNYLKSLFFTINDHLISKSTISDELFSWSSDTVFKETK